MERFHLRHATLLLGVLAILAGMVVAFVAADPGGLARVLGTAGLGLLAARVALRGVRLYRADATAALPESVGRVPIQARPGRLSTAVAVLFALVLPVAVFVALLTLVEWAWIAVAGALLFGALALVVKNWEGDHRPYADPRPVPTAVLVRLCMRADLPVPELVLEPGRLANAWTTAGRVHLTAPLLKLLDESELEAVLAHELAHLAHRDAAIMDVCSAPSRVLLSFVGFVVPGFRTWLKDIFLHASARLAATLAVLSVLTVPPAFLLGWLSRLSVLGLSRNREFAADAVAATLTGRPSALASALMKLDNQRVWLPRADLRQVEAKAVLCIVGTDGSKLRPLRSHPRIAARIERLQALERRMHAR